MSATPMKSTEKVAECWGPDAPDWVLALAALVDESGQARAATAINYSKAVVSMVLSNSYGGDMARVETAVRGALQDRKVACPVLGEIGANICIAEQRKPLLTTTNLRIRLWRACRDGCPHSFLEKRHAVG